eukprot:TRINITY_DN4975_c0_g1_i1.p1 TRINITY_DN4975_c0_g1~~TRINITY_DN4975_c0_g1_i1.p1  ORF type:complete len:270 (+),score=46.23 TRINITY_DN4975_c0_g1_i1:405-1214(+)
MQPVIGQDSIARILLKYAATHLESKPLRDSVRQIFRNLSLNDEVRNKIFAVESLSSFVNAGLPKESRYIWSSDRKSWRPASVTDISHIKTRTSIRDSGSVPNGIAKGGEWLGAVIAFLNVTIAQALKDESVPVNITILDINLPTVPTEIPAIALTPYMKDSSQLCLEFLIQPRISLRISASKGPLSVTSVANELRAEGTVILGLHPPALTPWWMSFPEMPKMSLNCDVAQISIGQILVTRVIEPLLKKSFLAPQKWFLDVDYQSERAKT